MPEGLSEKPDQQLDSQVFPQETWFPRRVADRLALKDEPSKKTEC
jgi:hypothetical protein